MNFFDSMEVLAAGLSAERVRMNTTSSNLANAQTTRTAEGGPYRRRDPVFEAAEAAPAGFGGALEEAMAAVEVTEVVRDPQPPRLVYDPRHPDANGDGYVALPNVNMVEEMVNMLTASRSYEAGVTAMHGLVEMAERALSMGK